MTLPEPRSSSRLDQIATLRAASPPRPVSPDLRRAALRQGAPLVVALIGGAFAAIGSILGVAFFPWGAMRDAKLRAADTAEAPGRIVAVEQTGMSINDRHVMRSTFEFTPADRSGVVRGDCYTTGELWPAGAAVTVRYRPEDLSVACPVGGRLSAAGAAMSFVWIFPLIGAALVFGTLRARCRMLHLLSHGTVGEAVVASIEPTNVQINRQRVYAITLRRTDDPSAAPLSVRRHQPDVLDFAQERLESKQPVFVLYDPAKPNRALLPETL